MRPKPYIGVSGISSAHEAQAVLDAFPVCARLPMIGVLVSSKTLRGIPNRYPRRNPPPNLIEDIFPDDPRALNLVHFSTDEAPESAEVEALFLAGGMFCHGAQFNGVWPAPNVLEYARWACEERPPRIVLQVRNWLSAELVVSRLRPYRGIATDVLLDGSGGQGRGIDLTLVRRAVTAIWEDDPDWGISIAGGFCAETIESVADLIREGASIDAEGKLRDAADGGGNLDLAEVAAYLKRAGEIIAGRRAA